MNYKNKIQGVFIHKSFFEIDDLSLPQKLIFAKICDLDNEKGCYASNKFFADLFKISTRQVSTHINNIIKKGYVTSKFVMKEGTKEIDYRVLNTTSRGIEELQHKGYGRTVPISKESNNNNNIKEREEQFSIEICALGLEYKPMIDPEIIKAFISHWTEPNRSGKKMKFELQQTWDHKRRLDTWIRNNKQWNKEKKPQAKKNFKWSSTMKHYVAYCECGKSDFYDPWKADRGLLDTKCCGKELLAERIAS